MFASVSWSAPASSCLTPSTADDIPLFNVSLLAVNLERPAFNCPAPSFTWALPLINALSAWHTVVGAARGVLAVSSSSVPIPALTVEIPLLNFDEPAFNVARLCERFIPVSGSCVCVAVLYTCVKAPDILWLLTVWNKSPICALYTAPRFVNWVPEAANVWLIPAIIGLLSLVITNW